MSASSSWSLPDNMISQHGKEVLIVDGYKMRFHKMLKNDTKRWCCAKKTCMSYMKTDAAGATVLESRSHHNHALDSDGNMLRQVVRNAAKRRAREHVDARPQSLITTELERLATAAGPPLTKTDAECIRKGIYLARRALRRAPREPADDARGVHDLLDSLTVETSDGEPFLAANDRGRRLVMFACRSDLTALCGARTICVDGHAAAVKSIPAMRILAVHGLAGDRCRPLAFFLLGDRPRAADAYASCFAALQRECCRCGLRLRPGLVYADSDGAVHAAARAAWPGACVRGTRYHLGRAWWRQIRGLGLAALYRDRTTEIGRLLRNVFGLPLLDAHGAAECFVEDFMAVKPDDERVDRFMDYLTENYIDSQSDYPPHVWTDTSGAAEAVAGACERFRARFNSSFRASCTDVFSLLKTLKNIQTDSKTSTQTSVDVSRKPNTAEQKKIAFIERNVAKYRTGKITRLHFVQLMASKNQPVKTS